MANKKYQMIGKAVILLLCGAILFFLLLPFLDGTAIPQSVRKSAPAKAIPQIFTSNPLGEMAQKILNALGYRYRHPTQQEILAGAPGRLPFTSENAPTAFAAQHTNGQTDTYTFNPNQSSDFPDAAFMNEEGEWMLVNQTDPESSNRGMHDIKFSDSAYDRLLRMERQAKYTRPQEQPAPAPSTWARLWNPVKKFFGFDSEEEQPNQAAQGESFELAAAQEAGRNPFPSQQAAMDWRQFIPSDNVSDEEYAQQINILLDPTAGLTETVEALKKTAKETLSPDEYKTWRNRMRQFLVKAQQAAKQQLEEDAAGTEAETFIDVAYTCNIPSEKSHTNGLYDHEQMCGFFGDEGSPLPSEQERQQLNQQAKKDKIQSQQLLDAKLAQLSGGAVHYKPLSMMVVLQEVDAQTAKEHNQISSMLHTIEATDPEQMTEEEKDHKMYLEFFKGYYDYLYDQQCGSSKKCYLVGSESQPNPAVQNSVESGGFDYLGDPDHVQRKLFLQYQQQYTDNLRKTDEQKADKMEDLLYDSKRVDQYLPYYVYYSGERIKELTAPRRGKTPILAFSPTAANGVELLETMSANGIIHALSKDNLFGEDSAYQTTTERGAYIRSRFESKLERNAQIRKQLNMQATKPTVQAIAKSAFKKTTSQDQALTPTEDFNYFNK